MRKLWLLSVSVFVIVSALAASGCVSKSDYEKLRAELLNSQDNITTLQKTLSSVQGELTATNDSLTQAQQSLDLKEDEIKTLETKLRDMEARLEYTNTKLSETEADLKFYQDNLGITIQSGIIPPFNKSSQIPIIPVNNPLAKDPTWQELIDFISLDDTDSRPYIDGVFMCGGFAEAVHNNAEAAGIRAAIVAIDFAGEPVGHALNAFKTADKGLVYIDSTGRGLQEIVNATEAAGNALTWDKIAYVAKGKEYGLLRLDIDVSSNYSFYQEEKTKWDIYEQKLIAYNQEVDAFNAEIAGKTYYIGTAEWQRIKQWESELIKKAQELDDLLSTLRDIWEPLGVVESVEIYW